VQRIEYRLVVLVDEHRRPLAGAFVQRFEQGRETPRLGAAFGVDRLAPLDGGELLLRACLHVTGGGEASAAEAQAHHGMAHRPVPVLVDGEPLEQRLAALEQLLAGVEEQALAEAARAREEVVLAFVQEPPDVPGLVDVVAAFLEDLAEGLDADGEPASLHRATVRLLPSGAVFARVPCPARAPGSTIAAPKKRTCTNPPGARIGGPIRMIPRLAPAKLPCSGTRTAPSVANTVIGGISRRMRVKPLSSLPLGE